MNEYGQEISTDYKDLCGNCRGYLAKEDRYCRRCCTKRGEGAFKPYLIDMACIYGPPPVRRKYVCTHCGHSWTSEMDIDDQKYCGLCGMPAKIVQSFPKYSLTCNVTKRTYFAISAEDKKVRVGRNPKLEVHLEDSHVSWLHAQFMVDEDGNLYLMDMGSSNGTYVISSSGAFSNQQRIGKEPFLLHGGDVIIFGTFPCTLNETRLS